MSIAVSQAGLGHQSGHQVLTAAQRLAAVNEETWLQIGKLSEMMNDLDRAMNAYESALRHNPYSIPAMQQIATILRAREQFSRAVEYFQSILNLDQNNGETWGSLGHCYLMMDDLPKAYSAYQQALYHLQSPKEPKLWYGIGILYDRYGSLDHAEEAFSQVMRMDPQFDKANEIYFRLGIIYKQQHKYTQSLECFNYIINNPPKPLTEVEIWFQLGHVYEQQKDFARAKETYERVLQHNPTHAKVLQQLGWLYHQQNSDADQDLAVQFLTRSLESDGDDAQSWYLLGRCYMAQRKYNKAYEAYQQAVYRDGRNPSFWCSIGVLYYQIHQYRDALDAYSRAIKLNPYISEVWYDLGTLYESCNDQINDALDAYGRASELDPGNPHIKARLEALKNGQSSGGRASLGGSAPYPQDVNPNAYQGGNAGQQPWNSQQQMQPSHQGPPPSSQMQQQQQQQQHQQHQGPPPQQHSQHSAAQQHNHRGHTTPGSAQTPFRPSEPQSMRPPHSPDRSKLQNGSAGRGGLSKMDSVPHMPPYQHGGHHPPQHSPYPAAHSSGPSIASLNHASGNSTTTTTPVPGSSLAPMLGRTSPVTEIKSLQSRDDGNAPREQPSTPGPSQYAHRNGDRNSRAATPRAASREPEANHLKRPREWDDHSSAPEAKKQELSDSSYRSEEQRAKADVEQSVRSPPARESSARPDAPREAVQQPARPDGHRSHQEVQQQEQEQQPQPRQPQHHESQKQEERPEAQSRPSSDTAAAEQIKEPVSSEKVASPSTAQQEQGTSAPREDVPVPSSTPAVKSEQQEQQPQPQESAERKVDLDEDYDEEED